METTSRRTLLRLAGLTTLALAAAPAVSACTLGRAGAEAGLVRSHVSRRPPVADAVPAAVAAVDRLAAGLYPAAGATGTNLVFSPFSVALALAMTANGAVGRTQRQMLSVLDASSVAVLDAGMNALVPALTALAGAPEEKNMPTLQIADALFGQSGLAWKQPFLDVLAADYGAGLHTVDFAGATEQAREMVNRWTSEQTAGKIPQILPEGSVTSLTALVLVNAIHVKARWTTQFSLPSPGPFHLADGSTVRVPTLQSGIGTAYGDGPGWTAASVPYVGGGLAMTLIVPEPAHGLPVVEHEVARHGVGAILGSLEAASVSVSMPAFSVRTGVSLAEALGALGMPLAFGNGADFSAMTEEVALNISDVVHQAVIEVDRDGTEATAATAVTMTASGIEAGGQPFVVDRPFLFVLHDVAHRTPLFVGRVADPRAGVR